MSKKRLQKYIAEAGILSRRKAGEAVKQGRVEVNGKILLEPWFSVGEKDSIKIDGKEIIPEEKKVYIMLNKPVKYISTVKDQFSRNTIMDLIKGINERLYPVGRLDYDTSGLLLLTNDGDFTYKLTHPKHEIKKTYIAEIKGFPPVKKIQEFERGLYIDRCKTSPAEFQILKKRNKISIVRIKIHEGRNRQIRKMCRKIGHPVLKLKRVAIGELNLGNLLEGKWRHLTKAEIRTLLEDN